MNRLKGIFFDIGYTLLQMNTGDWRATNKFYEYVPREYLAGLPGERIARAYEAGNRVLSQRNFVRTEEEELAMNEASYRAMIDEFYELDVSDRDVREIARDRTYNMENYIFYDGLQEVFARVRERYRIGIISDTWPTADRVLKKAGVYEYIESRTYSCYLGVTKPDPRMFTHALADMGLRGEEALFVDDLPANLAAANQQGITPVLILTREEKGKSGFREIETLREILDILLY